MLFCLYFIFCDISQEVLMHCMKQSFVKFLTTECIWKCTSWACCKVGSVLWENDTSNGICLHLKSQENKEESQIESDNAWLENHRWWFVPNSEMLEEMLDNLSLKLIKKKQAFWLFRVVLSKRFIHQNNSSSSFTWWESWESLNYK